MNKYFQKGEIKMIINIRVPNKEDVEEFKRKMKIKIHNGKDWCRNNKDLIITYTPMFIGGLTTVTKIVGKQMNNGKEKELKELYCYDRSLGHYWRLKRDLSNREWLDIDRRKQRGERLSDILSDMKVLK